MADAGEGQHPDDFPDTLCSTRSSNKDRIPFAQGRYNMGGTGALRFCGEHHLQFVLSRRSASDEGAVGDWGFTVVRREDPAPGYKNTIYAYLAPIGSQGNPRQGDVLRFSRETMDIFPLSRSDGSPPISCARPSSHGTLVKLYDYLPKLSVRGVCATSEATSLMRRMEARLLNFALPVRLYDCRGVASRTAENSTIMYGLENRLRDQENASAMEHGFPRTATIGIDGSKVSLTIYAFGLGTSGDDVTRKSAMYCTHGDGLLWTLNAQVQGHKSRRFFARRSVGMDVLSDSLLVVVDCTTLAPRQRDDLFMASRDRIADNPLSRALVDEISHCLQKHPDLRALRDRRQAEISAAKSAKITDATREIVSGLLQDDPALSRFLFDGVDLVRPKVRPQLPDFIGQHHPTYFRHKHDPPSRHKTKQVAAGRRFSIEFETDAVDDYFTREADPGDWVLCVADSQPDGASPVQPASDRLTLSHGVATLSVNPDDPSVGDKCRYTLLVEDSVHQNRRASFSNDFTINYVKRSPPSPNPVPPAPKHTLPEMLLVEEKDWARHSPVFTPQTAVRIYSTGNGSDDSPAGRYTWHLNVDNAALVRQINKGKGKGTAHTPEEARAFFHNAMLLIGLASLQMHERMHSPETHDDLDGTSPEDASPQDFVEWVTASAATVLWPIAHEMEDGR